MEMWLAIHLWMVEWWKKEVFFSHSLSQWILDFCFQSISSWSSFSSIRDLRSFSWASRASVLPELISSCWRFSIRSRRSRCPWKMLLKVLWFQCFSIALMILSFYCILYIMDPFCGGMVCHQCITMSRNPRWGSQNCSNWKGLGLPIVGLSHYNWIGQWFDPSAGSMVENMSPIAWMMGLETRKQSRWEAIKWFLDHW